MSIAADLRWVVKKLVVFLRDAFSDGGTPSSSRILAGAVTISVICWVTYLVLVHRQMPELSGPSMFLGTGSGATYGINKAEAIVTAFKNQVKKDS